MLEHLWIDSSQSDELNLYQCGIEDCSPEHFYGPAVRDHFLLHCVHRGHGRFEMDGKQYEISPGQVFLIWPDAITFYQADHDAPWYYSWVGFHGRKAKALVLEAGLSRELPLRPVENSEALEACMLDMVATKAMKRGRDARLLGLLYVFLSHLIEADSGQNPVTTQVDTRSEYVLQAKLLIERNYSHRLSIGEIARQVHLDRSYLGSLFKDAVGMSMQEYMIRCRINRACELLRDPRLSIAEVAYSVGYEDPLLFSKIFRKCKGMPPRDFRRTFALIEGDD